MSMENGRVMDVSRLLSAPGEAPLAANHGVGDRYVRLHSESPSQSQEPPPSGLRSYSRPTFVKRETLFTIIIDNEGSSARDHLANERTLLAWFRTSISLIVFGLGIAKFAPGVSGVVPGAMLVLLGTIFLSVAADRYFSVMRALQSGKYVIMSGGIAVVLVLTVIIILGCIVVVFAMDVEQQHRAAIKQQGEAAQAEHPVA